MKVLGWGEEDQGIIGGGGGGNCSGRMSRDEVNAVVECQKGWGKSYAMKKRLGEMQGMVREGWGKK